MELKEMDVCEKSIPLSLFTHKDTMCDDLCLYCFPSSQAGVVLIQRENFLLWLVRIWQSNQLDRSSYRFLVRERNLLREYCFPSQWDHL